MPKIRPALTLAMLVVSGVFFHNFTHPHPADDAPCLALPTEAHFNIERNGKLKDASRFEEMFLNTSWDNLGFPVINAETALALQHHLHVLRNSPRQEGRKSGNLSMNAADLQTVIELLLQRRGTQPNDLHQYLDAWQVWGDDRHGNVYFTGYFTPVLKVKKQCDAQYRYPIYAFPQDWKGPMPSRRDIDKKYALAGRNLELAYAANPYDVYVMQLQGSGTVEFVDTGERTIFRYAGENGHRYRNIQRFFKNRKDLAVSNLSPDGIQRFLLRHPEKTDSVLHYNPSYTFFEPKKGLAKGAGEVPLLEDISIAADPRYFPLGSVVLAALPVYAGGRITHHEYRLLLPQDVGGAIKGAGRIDVYCGNGDLGRRKAAALHHYGKLWVLLPKKNEVVAVR